MAGKTLINSLRAEPMRINSQAVWTRVGSPKQYAATTHQGSKPHVIRSRSGKMLKFRWERGNLLVQRRRGRARQFFFFEKVTHPGNKRPRRYLTTPLAQFGRAAGFTVSTVPVNRSFLSMI